MSDSEKDLNTTEVEEVKITPDPDPIAPKAEEPGTPNKPKKSKGDIVRRVIQIIAIVVAVGCIAFLVYKYVSSRNESKANNEIKDKAVSENSTSASVEIDDEGDTSEKTFSLSTIDFDTLEEEAGDNMVGWVEVPSVGISYPIVQCDDNETYLNTNYKGDFAWSGAIFLDYRSDKDFSDLRSTIFGHHMTDGSMFAGLLEYDDEDFFKKQEEADNNYFFVYLPDKVLVYKIFSVCDVTYAEHSELFVAIHGGEDNVEDFLESAKAVELYSTGVDVSKSDQIVTLYTCQADSASGVRHMVHGKLVSTIEN